MLSSLYSRLLRQSFEVEFMRWGLVLIFLMFGYTKWFDYEAQVLIPLIWEASAGGFPAMGGATSFLIKDLVLMAGSLVLLKNAAQQLTIRFKQSDAQRTAV